MQDYECEATLRFEQETGVGISPVQTVSYDPVMLVHFLDYHMIICDSLLWGEIIQLREVTSSQGNMPLQYAIAIAICGVTHRSGSVCSPSE